jgi:hypothetical protein
MIPAYVHVFTSLSDKHDAVLSFLFREERKVLVGEKGKGIYLFFSRRSPEEVKSMGLVSYHSSHERSVFFL